MMQEFQPQGQVSNLGATTSHHKKCYCKDKKNFKLTCFSTYSFPWLAICAPYPTATLAMGPCRNSLPANCPNCAENPGISCLFSILVSSNNGVGPVDPP